ncbi:unnamed protein product [Parnassius apollo]|uniref:(apollo) hypothetical protein n=1 Tax=Parnassius apollo TaxID=110799 RepID=A0A8S3WFA0_PARAO|nr:unnamed protein product [Parnassius apollo]
MHSPANAAGVSGPKPYHQPPPGKSPRGSLPKFTSTECTRMLGQYGDVFRAHMCTVKNLKNSNLPYKASKG